MNFNNDYEDSAKISSENEKINAISKTVIEYAVAILVCVAAAFILRAYVIERADVDGRSMNPTLKDKDIVFVEKLSNISHSYKRGEIVIFNSHNAANDIYIKRVVAVAGDEVEIRNEKLFVNGEEVKEDYLSPGTKTDMGQFMMDNRIYKVPQNYIFVLGDNREHSLDSRALGPINIKDVKGHAVIRVYPFKDIRIF